MWIIRITYKDGTHCNFRVSGQTEAEAFDNFCRIYGNPFDKRS